MQAEGPDLMIGDQERAGAIGHLLTASLDIGINLIQPLRSLER